MRAPVAVAVLLAAFAVPAGAAGLEPVAFIAGHWRGAAGEGDVSEEIWSVPEGDSMMGMWRWVGGGKVRLFELLTIVAEPAGPVFRLRHFDPQGIGREPADAPLVLSLVRSGTNLAVFEGKDAGGGPLRLTYHRAAPDALEVTLEKGDRRDVFQFKRVP